MAEKPQRIVLTGFMGVGKSTVARILSYRLGLEWIDLDRFIVENEKREIAEIIEQDGEERFRDIENENLSQILSAKSAQIISLGGGAWIFERNREIIKENECLTVWLNAPFDFCWKNIFFSKQNRPLAKDKTKALRLFENRGKYYCLADWHFVVRNEQTLNDVAEQIAEEIF